MQQTAPDPAALRELVQLVRYKGYIFCLEDCLDRGQGSVGMTLVIQVAAPDSRDADGRIIYVNHYMIVPAAAYDRRSWQRWIFEQILLVERHEAAEFFCVGDDRPYAPSHGPGNDPYVIRDVGTREDQLTDQRGVLRERVDKPAPTRVAGPGRVGQ